ncbi:hypothetical protein, partial [Leuconostoc mesenteroides]|uniref:hypothetical protein n=1 Tax=Leuconostoc mesenteroides TaxID=1245 RepID=UPI001C98EDCC
VHFFSIRAKKLAWSIIFLSLIVVVSGLISLTLMYTDLMLAIYATLGLELSFVGIICAVLWAIFEVKK